MIKNDAGENVYLDKDNPYLELTNNYDENRWNMSLSSNLIEKAIELEKRTCLIRVICSCDIILCISYIFYNLFIGLAFLFISIGGFFSTVYYKKSLMYCYLLYQYLQVILRFYLIFLAVFPTKNMFEDIFKNMFRSVNLTLTNETQVEDTAVYVFYWSNLIINCFLLFCQVIIAKFVRIYYNLLPTDEEKMHLRVSALRFL